MRRCIVLLFVALPLYGQAFDIRDTVSRIATLIEEGYVDPEAGKRVATHLRQELAAGTYRDLKEAEAFARALTDELRRVGQDLHFEVVVRSPQPAAPAAAPDWLTLLRRRNFDFARVENLAGNVGYLDLRSFPPPEVAGDTASAAMAFLANADVVIIDLRENGGGTGDMVLFLATYFFADRTTLTRTYRRNENRVTDDRTLPYVPGRRLPSTPLCILTSGKTVSAAEAFAFGLQQTGRAKVIGERTKGAANAGRYRRVSDLFSVFVSNAHAMAADADKSWERTGVQPDIDVPAAEALVVATRKCGAP
jgi:hypothetical protein